MVVAKMVIGVSNARAIFCAPVLSSTNSVCVHVAPPSVLRYTPRSWLFAWTFPCAASSTMFGSCGSTDIDGICFVASRPRCRQVCPASVDL
jgi:hypothetical protein